MDSTVDGPTRRTTSASAALLLSGVGTAYTLRPWSETLQPRSAHQPVSSAIQPRRVRRARRPGRRTARRPPAACGSTRGPRRGPGGRPPPRAAPPSASLLYHLGLPVLVRNAVDEQSAAVGADRVGRDPTGRRAGQVDPLVLGPGAGGGGDEHGLAGEFDEQRGGLLGHEGQRLAVVHLDGEQARREPVRHVQGEGPVGVDQGAVEVARDNEARCGGGSTVRACVTTHRAQDSLVKTALVKTALVRTAVPEAPVAPRL